MTVRPSILLYNFDINRHHFSPAFQKAHLPDLETFNGLKDVMALCSIIELGNVMSPWSYEQTPNGQRERERMIYARKRSRRLIAWIFYLYEVSDEDGNVVADGERDIYWRHVEQQARVLCHYKKRTWKEGILGSNVIKCRPADVERVIFRCFSSDLDVLAHFQSQFGQDEKTFAWVGPMYTVRRRLEAELAKITPPPGRYSLSYHAMVAEESTLQKSMTVIPMMISYTRGQPM